MNLVFETGGSVKISPLPGGRTKIEILPENGDGSEQQYLSKKQVADRFGVTPRTVENWTKSAKNPLPVIKGAGQPKFSEVELNNWVARGRGLYTT